MVVARYPILDIANTGEGRREEGARGKGGELVRLCKRRILLALLSSPQAKIIAYQRRAGKHVEKRVEKEQNEQNDVQSDNGEQENM